MNQSASRARRIAFRVFLGLLLVGLLGPEGWTWTLPIATWLPDNIVNDFLASRVDQASIHRIHLMEKGLAHVIVTVGFLMQVGRPLRNEASMWLSSAFFVLAIVLNLAAGTVSAGLLPPQIYAIFAVGILIGILHPSAPLVHLPRPTRRPLLGLTAVMAAPMGVYAVRQFDLQAGGAASNPHWDAVHYIFSSEIGFLLILGGVVSASRFTGWRATTWMTGLAAVVLGAISVAFPTQDSSPGIGWGIALALWGVVFIATGVFRGASSEGVESTTALERSEIGA